MLLEQKSSPELEALGRSRGGLTIKIHVRCEGTGRLITFLLTPGQQSDITLAEDLMETDSILRRNGHYRLHLKRLVADKGLHQQCISQLSAPKKYSLYDSTSCE